MIIPPKVSRGKHNENAWNHHLHNISSKSSKGFAHKEAKWPNRSSWKMNGSRGNQWLQDVFPSNFPHSSNTSSNECLVSTFHNWKESPLIVTKKQFSYPGWLWKYFRYLQLLSQISDPSTVFSLFWILMDLASVISPFNATPSEVSRIYPWWDWKMRPTFLLRWHGLKFHRMGFSGTYNSP